MPQSLPGSIREGFTEEEEVGLSLRLEGWVGVYQLSTGERASRQMVLSGPKTQRVEEHIDQGNLVVLASSQHGHMIFYVSI